MSHMRATRRVPAAVLAALAAVTACGDEQATDGPADATVSTIAPGTPLVEGIELRLDPEAGYGTDPLAPVDCPDGCRGWQGRVVGVALDARIDLALWGEGCVVTEGLNGQRVQYRTPTDALSGRIVDTRDVPAGTATSIADVYVECTNDCVEYEDRIVVVEFAPPVDDRFRSVMISTIADVPFDDLFAIAGALRAG